jgi:hypothetical protein
MPETVAHRRSARRYSIELSSALVLYAGVLIPTIFWLRAYPDASARWAVALLPAIPVLLVFWAVIRFLSRMDELGRRMVTEALAAAFAGSAMLVITFGLLEVGGMPRMSPWLIWIAMGAIWALASAVVIRRFR